MDDADRASLIIESDCSRAIKSARAALNSGNLESAIECEDCEEPIPEARQKVMPGCTRCVACQERFERG